MATVFGSVAAYTVLLSLLIGAVGHLASPATLPRALTWHRLLPRPKAVAVGVTATEVGLAAVVAVAVSGQVTGGLLTPVLAASAVLFACYGGYSQLVKSTRPGAPCGCSRSELPVTGWVVARAYSLAGLALLAAVLPASVLTLDRPGAPLAVTLLAAATFGALLWHLPTAAHLSPVNRPSTLTRQPLPAGRPVRQMADRYSREGTV